MSRPRKTGHVFIADRNFHGIWKFANGKLEKFFEGSAKFRTPLNAVRCVAMDHQGKLLAGDSATREVYRFDEAGNPVPLTKGRIGIPTAIAVRKSGEILVADQELLFIWKMPAEGGEPVKLAEVPADRRLVPGSGRSTVGDVAIQDSAPSRESRRPGRRCAE